MVIEAQQWIKDAVWAFADYLRLENSVKTNDADFSAAQEGWKQQMAAYEKEFAEFKQEVNHKSADRS